MIVVKEWLHSMILNMIQFLPNQWYQFCPPLLLLYGTDLTELFDSQNKVSNFAAAVGMVYLYIVKLKRTRIIFTSLVPVTSKHP